MNKIKIPKNWIFKYFEVDGNTTKFVYEDQLGIEHVYIDEKPEQELPTYEELQDKYNKQKEVLDKIKEMTKDLFETEYEGIYKKDEDNCCEKFYLLEELNKLLEEIE